ncbi:unnamed protein product [Brugia pahangi]|uniref:FAS1 domain-containing protein n=1 Tax=Brugia pahangi TaxID=6280 RepID=A0A0N4TV41_BRUPA|nr:unnamed protein product [Brugia pahangi]
MSNALLILVLFGNYPLMSLQSDSKTQSVILTESRREFVLAHFLRASLPFSSLRSASEKKSGRRYLLLEEKCLENYNKSARNDDDDCDDNGDDDDVGDEIIEAITITAQQLF